jgi:site-specific DNA recombinase
MDAMRRLDQLEQVVARDYLRVSSDPFGRSSSTSEQHGDHETDSANLGWQLGGSYSDKGISASRYARKVRGDFKQLCDDLEEDRFDAQVLMLWESSRGSRRVGEWVNLVDLCELRGVYIWVHTHRRLYDASNPYDRSSLLKDAVESELQSAQTSDRVRRHAAANALAGRPAGPVPFGYARLYDLKTGELVTQVPVKEEADLVEELFERALRGVPWRHIAFDWKTRDIRNRRGNFFTEKALRAMTRNPSYAGLRAHVPGRGAGSKPWKSMHLHPGIWEAIIGRPDWDGMQRVLDVRTLRAPRPTRGKWLLSMITRCGVCDGTCTVSFRHNSDIAQYGCTENGCVRVRQTDLDEYVIGFIVDYLGQDEILEDLRGRDESDDREAERIRDELANLRQQIDEIPAGIKAGLSPAIAGATEKMLTETMTDLESQLRAVFVPAGLRGLIEPGRGFAQRWADAEGYVRRETARAVLVPERLGQVILMRAGRRSAAHGGRAAVEDRVMFRRAESAPLTPST